MKPSPGPWRWVKGYWDLLGLFSQAGGEERCVLQAGSSQDIHSYNADDAALIAAAPEMREMLLWLDLSFSREREEHKLHPCVCASGNEPCRWCAFDALLERIR